MNARIEPSCRAAVFLAADEPLRIESFDVPAPAPGEAVVQIEMCTICGSDLHTIGGLRNEPTPSILGHEAVGTIHRVGDPAPVDMRGAPLQLGDRITWAVCTHCGECDRCLRGMKQKCRTLFKYGHGVAEGHGALSGGMAEYLLLRRGSSIVKLSDELPSHVVCPANCATATIAAAFRKAGNVDGRRVLVIGAGMLGLTASAYARTHGASSVTICDVAPNRLAVAENFGANHIVLFSELAESVETHAGFDTIIECSGSADAVEMSFRVADIGATIVLVGSVMNTRPIELDPQSLVRRLISVHGVHNYSPQDLEAAVAFLESTHAKYPFESLAEKTFSLDRINDAIGHAQTFRPVRVAIRPDSNQSNSFSS